jgi:peptide/nickel transport system substrate-binding protein
MMKPGVVYDMLATSYAWSDGGRTLAFHIRRNVKWSDRVSFSNADVTFTFSLIKKYPALNVNGVQFSSVVSGPEETILHFSAPSYTELYLISQVLIVPEHIWSHIANPVTFADTSPVGTGPYLLKSFSASVYTLVRNPNYWIPGEPKVQTIEVPQYASNTSVDPAVERGLIDWANNFIPHYKQLFLNADPATNHVYLPQIGPVFICTNDSKYPLNLVSVREALSYAINRQQIVVDSEQGFAGATSNATALLPQWGRFLAPQYKDAALSYNPARAKAMLIKAGFKVSTSGKLIEPNGKPFDITFVGPSPFTDFMTDMQFIVSSFDSIGINAKLEGESVASWASDYTNGTYEATMCGVFQIDTPFDLYNDILNSTFTAPVGKAATGDFERWTDPVTDQYLHAYSVTLNPEAQANALAGLEGIMVKDMPLIPLMGYSTDTEYRTNHFVGWVTAANQYQMPGAVSPWTETVILHLRPVG